MKLILAASMTLFIFATVVNSAYTAKEGARQAIEKNLVSIK